MSIPRRYYSGGTTSINSLIRNLKSVQRKQQQIEDSQMAFDYKYDFISPEEYLTYTKKRAEEQAKDGDQVSALSWQSKAIGVERKIYSDARASQRAMALFEISSMGDNTVGKANRKITMLTELINDINSDPIIDKDKKDQLLLSYMTQLNNAQNSLYTSMERETEKGIKKYFNGYRNEISDIKSNMMQVKKEMDNASSQEEFMSLAKEYSQYAFDLSNAYTGQAADAMRAKGLYGDTYDVDYDGKIIDAEEGMFNLQNDKMVSLVNNIVTNPTEYALVDDVDSQGRRTTEIVSRDRIPQGAIDVGGRFFKPKEETRINDKTGMVESTGRKGFFVPLSQLAGANNIFGIDKATTFDEWLTRKGIDAGKLNTEKFDKLRKQYDEQMSLPIGQQEKINDVFINKQDKSGVFGKDALVPDLEMKKQSEQRLEEQKTIARAEALGIKDFGLIDNPQNFVDKGLNYLSTGAGTLLNNIDPFTAMRNIAAARERTRVAEQAEAKRQIALRQKMAESRAKSLGRGYTRITPATKFSKQQLSASKAIAGLTGFSDTFNELTKAYYTGGYSPLLRMRGNQDYFRERATELLTKRFGESSLRKSYTGIKPFSVDEFIGQYFPNRDKLLGPVKIPTVGTDKNNPFKIVGL